MGEKSKQTMAIIVMGVSGSGKSSVGQALATRLGLAYIEGDSLHPESNVEKMGKGIPLTDEDRWPWLDIIGDRLRLKAEHGVGVVITCSSLKRIYRDRLRLAAGGALYFVYLEGSKALLSERMGERKGHFMPASLLESQLQTLEVPTGEPLVVTVSIDDTVHGIVDAAVDKLAAIR